jgi:hypothetical protein
MKKKQTKRVFRLIYQSGTDMWYFIEMPFGLYWGCTKANMKPMPTRISHGSLDFSELP